MKPELLNVSFEANGVRVSLKTSATDTVSTVLPIVPGGIDHLTIGQLREAAIHQVTKQK